MISLAATIALTLFVILFSKVKQTPGPLPVAALALIAIIEVSIIFYYMYSMEIPAS